MKKLLLLNGSPRGKDSVTLKLSEAFVEGYVSRVEAEVRRVDLADGDIGSCTGCYGCWKGGLGACVQKDDMEELLPAYEGADFVLVSTPVYHFGMTSILKAFFERTLPSLYPYMVKRGELFSHPRRREPAGERRFGLVATCGFPDGDNFRAMGVHFDKLLGRALAFKAFVPEGELLNVPQMREAAAPRIAAMRAAGEAFAVSGSFPAEDLALLAEPMVAVETFARLANASWGVPGEEPPTEAAFSGLEPYSPRPPRMLEGDGARGSEAGAEPEEVSASPARALLSGMAGLFSPEVAGDLRAILRFDFTDRGEAYDLVIEGGACSLLPASGPKATTTISTPFETWERISRGELGGEEALLSGAYRVEGDFGLMMRMNALFGSSRDEDAAGGKKPRNLMALAFVPWYCGWFLGGSSPWLGQLLPLGLSLAFLAWRESRREATWFERGTPAAFACLSAIAWASPGLMAGLYSALCNTAIALVWGLSLLYGRPLTSDYSRLNYPTSIVEGPIFRRVNAILTGFWTLLFALSAASGFAAAGSGQGAVALVDAFVLIPAGIFTAWFPRWYPGHLARRGSPAVRRA